MDAIATTKKTTSTAAADAVLERAWCRICRRSSDVKWKKHVFTRNHQQRALDFLQQRIAALEALLYTLPTATSTLDSSSSIVVVSTQTLAQLKWNCSFCETSEYVLLRYMCSFMVYVCGEGCCIPT